MTTGMTGEPLQPWVVALGFVVFAVSSLGLLLTMPLGLAVAVILTTAVGATISAALYQWRGESFAEGWATGAIVWPLSIPFAIWGLRR